MTTPPSPDRALYNKSGKLPFGISDDDLYNFNEWLIKHDTAIRKEEREKVLDELTTYCNDKENIINFDYPYGGWSDDMIDNKWLLEKIKSLRGDP